MLGDGATQAVPVDSKVQRYCNINVADNGWVVEYNSHGTVNGQYVHETSKNVFQYFWEVEAYVRNKIGSLNMLNSRTPPQAAPAGIPTDDDIPF